MKGVRAAGTIIFLLFLGWFSARAGFASLLSTYAALFNQPDVAEAAVRFGPGDPYAHQIRGAILEAADDPSAATTEYTQAVRLRPNDYVLWLSLAHGRELSGDLKGAIAAGTEAVQLAPYYAEPHWQLGNTLVRAGRADDGFRELRLAAASNPLLLPSVIDLAWRWSHDDAEYVLRAIRPDTPQARNALAEYFRKRGKVKEAITLLRSGGSFTEDLRRRFTDELISAKRFQDAYELWSIAHPSDPAAENAAFARGFEVESDLSEPGFGWRAKKTAGVVLSLDDANPRQGKLSLRIDFQGDSDPSVPLITQLAIIDRPARYQLHFAVRTEALVSGGLPGMIIIDAGSGQQVGQSGAFPPASNGWRDYTIDFTVPAASVTPAGSATPRTSAGPASSASPSLPSSPGSPENSATPATIQIILQRERCSRTPCPIFGRLWLDNFSLQKL
jgi:tetratricopeptide (TPR) repeat protein